MRVQQRDKRRSSMVCVLAALVLVALLVGGCTPESSIPAVPALSEEASSSIRAALAGRWVTRGEVDGRDRTLILDIEEHALRVAVDDDWEAWRAWVPLRDESSAQESVDEAAARRIQLLVIHPEHLRSEGLRLVGASLYLDSMPDYAFERVAEQAR